MPALLARTLVFTFMIFLLATIQFALPPRALIEHGLGYVDYYADRAIEAPKSVASARPGRSPAITGPATDKPSGPNAAAYEALRWSP